MLHNLEFLMHFIKNPTKQPSYDYCIQNHLGLSVLPLIAIIVFISILATAGAKYISSQINKEKYIQTKESMDEAIQAIIGWSVSNGRLPLDSEYPTMLTDHYKE